MMSVFVTLPIHVNSLVSSACLSAEHKLIHEQCYKYEDICITIFLFGKLNHRLSFSGDVSIKTLNAKFGHRNG